MSQPAPFAPFASDRHARLMVRAERPGFCVADSGPLVVSIWTRTAVGEDVDLVGKVQRQVLDEYSKCIVVTIIRAPLSMAVDDEVREKGQAIIRDCGDATLRNVLVVEGGGLRANFFRSVVTGLYFLSRKSSAQKVSASIDEAMDWALEPFRDGTAGIEWDDLDPSSMAREVNRFADDFTQRQASEA